MAQRFRHNKLAARTSYLLISAISSSMRCSSGARCWSSPLSAVDTAKESLLLSEVTEGRWMDCWRGMGEKAVVLEVMVP